MRALLTAWHMAHYREHFILWRGPRSLHRRGDIRAEPLQDTWCSQVEGEGADGQQGRRQEDAGRLNGLVRQACNQHEDRCGRLMYVWAKGSQGPSGGGSGLGRAPTCAGGGCRSNFLEAQARPVGVAGVGMEKIQTPGFPRYEPGQLDSEEEVGVGVRGVPHLKSGA